MKVKEGFMMHKVGERAVVVAVGENTKKFHGMIHLNQTGEFLWKLLCSDTTEEDLLDALTETYEVERAEAKRDWTAFWGNSEKREWWRNKVPPVRTAVVVRMGDFCAE